MYMYIYIYIYVFLCFSGHANCRVGGDPRTLGEDPKTSPASLARGAGVSWLGGDPRTLGEDPMTSPVPPGQGYGRILAGKGPDDPGCCVAVLFCCCSFCGCFLMCVCCFCCVMVVADG